MLSFMSLHAFLHCWFFFELGFLISTSYQSQTRSESSFLVHSIFASSIPRSILSLICAFFSDRVEFSLYFLLICAQFSFPYVLIFFAILSKLKSEIRVSIIEFHLDLDLIVENSILDSYNRDLGFVWLNSLSKSSILQRFTYNSWFNSHSENLESFVTVLFEFWDFWGLRCCSCWILI